MLLKFTPDNVKPECVEISLGHLAKDFIRDMSEAMDGNTKLYWGYIEDRIRKDGLLKVDYYTAATLGDDGKVELKLVENPKEITCKGGLNMKQRFVVDDVEEITRFRTGSATLDAFTVPRYDDINAKVREEVLASYREFVDYFFALNKKYSFTKYFGVSNEREFALFRTVLTEKAEQDFNKAIEARRDSMTDEENPEIKDSLFFIPLTGGISRLALHIAQNG